MHARTCTHTHAQAWIIQNEAVTAVMEEHGKEQRCGAMFTVRGGNEAFEEKDVGPYRISSRLKDFPFKGCFSHCSQHSPSLHSYWSHCLKTYTINLISNSSFHIILCQDPPQEKSRVLSSSPLLSPALPPFPSSFPSR